MATPDVDIHFAAFDFRPRVENRVHAVVPLISRVYLDHRAQWQEGRIGRRGAALDGNTRSGRGPFAIRGRADGESGARPGALGELRWIESRVFTWYSPMNPPTATTVTSTLRRMSS